MCAENEICLISFNLPLLYQTTILFKVSFTQNASMPKSVKINLELGLLTSNHMKPFAVLQKNTLQEGKRIKVLRKWQMQINWNLQSRFINRFGKASFCIQWLISRWELLNDPLKRTISRMTPSYTECLK